MESEVQIIENDRKQEPENAHEDYKEEVIKDAVVIENDSGSVPSPVFNENSQDHKDFAKDEKNFESENKITRLESLTLEPDNFNEVIQENPKDLPNFKVVLNTESDKHGVSNPLIQDSLKLWNDKKTIKINQMRLKHKALEAEQIKTKPDINKDYKTLYLSSSNLPKTTKNSEYPKNETFINKNLAKSSKNLPSTTKNVEIVNKTLKPSENNIENTRNSIKPHEKSKNKTLPKEFSSFTAFKTQKSKKDESEIETVDQFDGTTTEMLKLAMKLRENIKNTTNEENSKSQSIANKKSENALKIQKEREDKELEECTFKPNLTQNIVKNSLAKEKKPKKTEKKQEKSEKIAQNIENPAFQYRVPPPNRKHHSNSEVKFFNQNVLVSERYSQITPIVIPVRYKTGFDYETLKNKAKPMVNYKIQSSLD